MENRNERRTVAMCDTESATENATLVPAAFWLHHRPMTDLVLKWRRTYPDNDQHFHALDPETFGEASVLNIIRNHDSTGIPTDWHWILLAPGVIGSYPGTNGGDAPSPREAAVAGEAAYQAFRAWISPEALERANQQAQDVIAGQKLWAKQGRRND